MKGKHLLIFTIIIILFLCIGTASAIEDGVNETIISQENDISADIIESDEVQDNELQNDESKDILTESIVIGGNPTGPSAGEESLTDLKNTVKAGVVFLNKNYTYKDGDPTDGIVIDSSIIIKGDNITIDGGNMARIFVINKGSLHISGVNFVNAKTNGHGAALYYNGGSGIIDSCSFVNCSATNGGAIYYDGLSLVINNTQFKDNSAALGAGAYVIANSTILANTIFSNNSARTDGGAFYWKKTSRVINVTNQHIPDIGTSGNVVYGEYSTAIGRANMIYLSSYSIAWGDFNKILNSNQTIAIGNNNTLSNSYGSSVIGDFAKIVDSTGSSYYNGLLVSEDLYVIDSTFTDNSAGNNGGSLFITTGTVNIRNSNFNGSESKYGGAIYAKDINVYNTNFTLNNANSQGGAIFVAGEANIYDSVFRKNTADFQGGAVFSGRSKNVTSVYNSVFDGNGLKNRGGNYYGGALYDADLIINCTFTNNYAWSGGAVYQWHDHNYYRLRIENSIFNNNTAIGTGGAVYAHYGANILYSNFTNNRAGDTGGGVGGWNHISYQCLFINNTAKNGGAIGGESARAYENLIINSTATQNGGAIWGFNLIIRDNLIINSTSLNTGGAIGTNEYLATTSTFRNNTIINAKALKGGAVYLFNHRNDVYSVFELNRIHNSSAEIGGAIYSHSITTLTNNIFENTSAVTGGAVYSDWELIVKNNTVTDSKADLGRDIYNEGKISTSYLSFIDGKTIMADYEEVLLIYANLSDDMGNTITGQNITFEINGTTQTLQAIEGAASFNYTVDFIKGQKTVTGSYEGSENEKTIVKSGLIRINLPVLSIIKTVEDIQYYNGDTVVYTIIVNNTGKGKAFNVIIRDNLPNGLELINSTSTKGIFTDNVWTLDELDTNESVSLTYTCLLTVEGLVKNEAIVSCDNADENSSSVTINVKPYQPHIKVEKIALTPIVIVGQNALFEIVINNTDSVSLKNVRITEDSFDGLTYDGYHESPIWRHSIINGKNVWTLMSDLAPKEVVSLLVNFKTTSYGNFTNNIIVNSSTLENKSANATVKVLYPHLDAKKVSLMPITKVGNQTLFEIVIYNDGEFDVHNVFIIEDSFEGLSYSHYLIDDLWKHSMVDGKHKWTMVEELAPKETIGLFVYFDTAEIGNFTNYAIVGSDETVSRTVNATVMVNETVEEPEGTNPKLNIKITALHPLVVAGGQIKFEVIVSNEGDVILNNVSIYENSFNGLVFDHMEDHTGLWYQTGSLIQEGLLGASDDELSWKMNMPLYKNETLGFFMIFNTTEPGTFTNSIIGSSDQTEPQIASDDVEVVVPQYTIEKVALNKTVNIGDKVYFEIIVKNTGKVNITDLVIIEQPDDGLSYDSFINSDGYWSEGADFTWNLKTTLLPNETLSLFIIFKTDKLGNLTNTVTSEDKSSNATVEVLNKTDKIEDNSTPEEEDDTPIDSTPQDSTPDEDNSQEESDKKHSEDKKVDIPKKSRTVTEVSENATGNPLVALLFALLILAFTRRYKK